MRIQKLRAALLLGAVFMALISCANLDTQMILDTLGDGGALDEATVAAGLKEALEVGTGRAVETGSTVDGFLGNALIRIALPEQFDDVASTLRNVGLGSKVDELELAMNRSAERASGEARGVFWDAIRGMSISEAFEILRGPDDAATLYFRERTENELRRRFEPIVQEKMGEVGLYNVYDEVSAYYDALPFVETPALDLDAYITDGALNGLFTLLAGEEKLIREDPIARTTALLRKVFGSSEARTGS